MKCAIGIVTYQPDISRLAENLQAALASTMASRVMVYDNHSDNIAAIR